MHEQPTNEMLENHVPQVVLSIERRIALEENPRNRSQIAKQLHCSVSTKLEATDARRFVHGVDEHSMKDETMEGKRGVAGRFV